MMDPWTPVVLRDAGLEDLWRPVAALAASTAAIVAAVVRKTSA